VSIGASALAAVFALTTAWSVTRAPEVTPGVPTRVVSMPEGGLGTQIGTHLAISDDGGWIAWITNPGPTGASRLYVRRVGERAGRLVPDSEGARDPVFSPDGAWVAFMADGSLRRAPLSGGPALTIASDGFFPSDWGEDGTIVGEEAGVLYRVRSTGGEIETILTQDAQGRAGYTPRFLPGGEAVLFTSYLSAEDMQVALLDLGSGEVRALVAAGGNASYVPTGHIVYGHLDQALFAAEFDLRRQEVIGDPVPVLQPVFVTRLGFTQFAVSSTGTAVYQTASGVADARLVLVDSTGAEEPLAIDPGGLSSPRFAPDGASIAYVAGGGDVYVYSLYRRNATRMTFEGVSMSAVWSRDGAGLIFASERTGTQSYDIFRANTDLTGSTERLLSLPAQQWPQAATRDGRILFRDNSGRGPDLRLADPRGDSVRVTDLLTEDWAEFAASLSPDERWLAYVSDEDGDDEVYVTAFPVPAGRVKISERGGSAPVWHPRGTSLYYLDDRADLIEAQLRFAPSLDVVGRGTLFAAAAYRRGRNVREYDVSPDGDRFVMLRISGESTAGDELEVVTNWFEELRERMGR
jgi:serine/threonine-protein kinase